MDEQRAAVRPDPCQEAMQALRLEVESLRTQVSALISRDHQRDLADTLITGGGDVVYGRLSPHRPALRAVPGAG